MELQFRFILFQHWIGFQRVYLKYLLIYTIFTISIISNNILVIKISGQQLQFQRFFKHFKYWKFIRLTIVCDIFLIRIYNCSNIHFVWFQLYIFVFICCYIYYKFEFAKQPSDWLACFYCDTEGFFGRHLVAIWKDLTTWLSYQFSLLVTWTRRARLRFSSLSTTTYWQTQ